MKIGLASPCVATSLADGISRIASLAGQAAARGARIVCFPEAYLPGLRGQDFAVLEWNENLEHEALEEVSAIARSGDIAIILGLEHVSPAGRQIAACVVDRIGTVVGYQFKTQLDPTEDRFYVPGDSRRLFELDGLKFGIAICHEGWRYPETVRWAATRGAQVVFHPQLTGNETHGDKPTEWGAAGNAYYERAMMMRSIENGIWFASVNYAVRYPEAATSLIDPAGRCQAFLPYGEEGVLVEDIDPDRATGLLARRFAPDRYRESTA